MTLIELLFNCVGLTPKQRQEFLDSVGAHPELVKLVHASFKDGHLIGALEGDVFRVFKI